MGTTGITTSDGVVVPNHGSNGEPIHVGQRDPNKPKPTWGGKPVRTDVFGDASYLTENLSRDNALPWQQYYDKGVVDTNDPDSLVSKALSRGKDYYNDAANYGVSDKTNFGTTPLTGGQQNPMADAIARKYQRDVSGKVRGLKNANKLDATKRESDNLGQAANVLVAAQQKENQNFLEQYDFQMKRYNLLQQHEAMVNAAHNAFIGNIIGIAGTVATMGMKSGG